MKKLILAQTDSSFPTSSKKVSTSKVMTKGGLAGELAKYGRGGRWPWRADQKDPGGLATPPRWGVSSEIRQQGRSPLPQEQPYPPKKLRRGRSRGGKAFSKRAGASYAKLDDKRELSKEKVLELRYSQLSCKETFQSISIAVGAGCLGSEGELVCALFAVDCFLRLQMKDQWTYPEVYRQSWTISIEGVCQDKWKGPLDGERQPLQAEYTHAGPALHKELQRHRRTWCAIAQEQEWQAGSTFDLRFPEVRAPSKRQAVSGVSRPTCYLLCKDQTRYELQAVPVRLILLCHQTGGDELTAKGSLQAKFLLGAK